MIRTLQSLRFIFIMLVVMFHILGNELFSFGGDCGVAFFFIISGFFLSLSNSKRIAEGTFSTRNLLLRQLGKLYPLHLLLAAIFLFLELGSGREIDLVKVLVNIFLLQGFTMSEDMCGELNSVSWFLSDILFCYAMFLPLYRILTRLRLYTLIATTILISTVYLISASYVPDDMANSWLFLPCVLRLIDFSLGIICYRITCSQCYKSTIAAYCRQGMMTQTMLELSAVALMLLTYFAYLDSPVWFRTCALFWLPILIIVVFFNISDRGKGLVARFLQLPVMQWCGSISFEIYLTHILTISVIMLFSRHLLGIIPSWQECGMVSIPLIILTAEFFSRSIYFLRKRHVI